MLSFQGSEKDASSMGFVSPTSPPSIEKDHNTPFNPAAFSYNIPLDNANSNKLVSNLHLLFFPTETNYSYNNKS